MDIHGISVRFPEGAGDFCLILVLRPTQPPIQKAIRGGGGYGLSRGQSGWVIMMLTIRLYLVTRLRMNGANLYSSISLHGQCRNIYTNLCRSNIMYRTEQKTK
jgi:hypothetical protein